MQNARTVTLDCLLAHLSRRLKYTHAPASVHLSQCSNISQTAGPIKAKFWVEPLWLRGTKVCLRLLGLMTKMAATLIYGKTLQKSSSPEQFDRFPRNLVCSIVCSNDDPRLTLTYFVARSNLVTGFSIGKVKTMDFFFRNSCNL